MHFVNHSQYGTFILIHYTCFKFQVMSGARTLPPTSAETRLIPTSTLTRKQFDDGQGVSTQQGCSDINRLMSK